ncbi:IS110 family RNA-guided transposase [Candidatus Hakubella thermalkaliphila]|uniref:IS110 family transposase n=1 Tax=Candidatus Hakubella thermalkaliphila TaxID=2754717 RepID=UPI0015938649|nr:IS110 family transposase [Candidatus Hakubella thermalkaliphila]
MKTDSLDWETLAHLLRSDLIAWAYAPSWETREVKNLLRFRISLVRIRTSLKNKVHSVLDRHPVEDNVFRGLTDKFGKTGMKIMRSLELEGNDRAILNGYLDLIEELSRRIAALNKQIKALVKEDEISSYLKSVPGFGDLLGLLLRYEIDNMERFASAKKLCSYVGIVPSTYSSGGKTWHGRITKEGNKWLRWAVIEAVHGAIITSPSLRRYYNRVKQRRGDKAATIALARKLLEIIYHVWKEKRPYYEKELAYTV